MSPELQTAAAIASLLQAVQGWQIGGVLVAVFVAPWFVVIIASIALLRMFNEMKQMYENNAILVKNYERLADALDDQIRSSTAIITKLAERINNLRRGG